MALAAGDGVFTRALAQARLTEAELLRFDALGNITLLHVADIHGQLMPVYFREPSVNLGAGAVNFAIDGAPESFTYFAINAGAKIAYNISRTFALVLSPQGDIAFSDESELTTTNAWVWPFTVGIRLRF